MNWRHLSTFLWLRWRVLRNQWNRGGRWNAVVLTVLAVSAVALSVPLFVGSFVAGLHLVPRATPSQLMYVWDGLIAGFVFFWSIGLLTELQRTETLTLSKFLHLPVSVREAFLINYVSSLLRFSLLIFLPLMAGFALSLISVQGWKQVPILLALPGLLLMVSALTYQFQGWLASLFSNPRRRRTIIMMITFSFVLICQLPNLLNMSGFWSVAPSKAATENYNHKVEQLDRDFRAKKVSLQEYRLRLDEALQLQHLEAHREFHDKLQIWEHSVEIANVVLPIGWLPLGVRATAEGSSLPLLLGSFGMLLIGSGSLWRAYRATLRLYTGEETSGAQPAAISAKAVSSGLAVRPSRDLMLEWKLPWLSEPVSAVALGGLRSLLRAPEAKMLLLSPLLIAIGFGSAILRGPRNLPEVLRTLIALGAMLTMLLCMVQIMFNQFGFDRDGFRVFVLSAVSRRDILLGKNMSFAPLAFGMTTLLMASLLFMYPLRLDHSLSLIPQSVSMYLLFCFIANLQSIHFPMYLAAGSLKPANPKTGRLLVQLLVLFILLPISQVPLLLPIGIESALEWWGWESRVPVCLMLSLIECAAVVMLYRAALHWQGRQLQTHEQAILESVTSKGA